MNANPYEAVLEDLKKRRLPPEVKAAVTIVLDKKAERVVVLKLKGVSEMTDYLLICHGNSGRQTKAIADALVEQLRDGFRLKPLGVEGERQGDWVLIDYVDFVINVFTPETREKYALEKLWMDAKRYDFSPME